MKTLQDPVCCAEIRTRLSQVQSDSPRQWGKMTAPQMICHLRDSYLGIMGDKAVVIPPGYSWWRLTKSFALYAPFKWPPGVPTCPEFDQQNGGTPPAQVADDMSALLATIGKFTGQPRSFSFQPHPMFGPMTEKDWMRWGYLHADHHLRQFGQ